MLAANEELYAAVEAGDLDRLGAVLADDREPVCVHPGTTPIRGRDPVLRSWALIMANADYIQFILTDVEVSLAGDVAVLTCTENILTAGDRAATFHGGEAHALNVFVRTEGGWRLWAHQAAPVGSGDL